MKNLIPLMVIFLMTINASAQKLAKNPGNKSNTAAEFRSDANYKSYITEAGNRISYLDMEISDILFFIVNMNQGNNEKAVDYLESLQKENTELKTDLRNFEKYGIGNWRLFQSEFNEDLKSLSADLEAMHEKFVHDYLMASVDELKE